MLDAANRIRAIALLVLQEDAVPYHTCRQRGSAERIAA